MYKLSRLAHASVSMLALLFVFVAGPALAQETVAPEGYQMPPEALAHLVDAPTTPAVSLSPDHTHMLLMHRPSLPSIAELAEPELRLAGLRINPRNNGPSRSGSFNNLTLRGLDGSNERAIAGLPEDARIRNISWSPDGQHFAFTIDGRNLSSGLYLYQITGRTFRTTERVMLLQ